MKKFVICLTITLLATFVALPAFAHIETTKRWGSNSVYYWPNFPGYDAVNRVKEAANDWNSKVPEFDFLFTDPGGHVIQFETSKNEVPSGVIARTYIYINQETGYIDDADTYLSNELSFYWGTSTPASYQYDSLTVFKHELGHWYMLADCYDSAHSNTLMYGYIRAGEVRRTITSHDYTPARYMY